MSATLRALPIAAVLLAAACSGSVVSTPTAPTGALLAGGNLSLVAPDFATPSAVTGRDIGPQLPPQNCADEGSLKSITFTTPTEIEVLNLSTSTKVVYWLSYTGTRVRYATLPAGFKLLQPTYVTHPWVIADEAGTCVAIYTAAAQPSTITIRDGAPSLPSLSVALIASSLATEINRSFIAAMQSADVPAVVRARAGVATCSAGGSVRVQHLGPAPGGGRVTLANTATIFSGCTHLLGGRSIVATGTVVANGFWTATEPTSPVRLSGDVEVEGLGPITIDGTTGVYFLGKFNEISVGPPDTQPSPNPGPAPAAAKYDGTYDFLLRYPTGPGTSGSRTLQRFLVIRNGVVSSPGDGSVAGTVDGSGHVVFTGLCPINSSTADWKGDMDWTAPAGANHGEGSYSCRTPVSGTQTWRMKQSW